MGEKNGRFKNVGDQDYLIMTLVTKEKYKLGLAKLRYPFLDFYLKVQTH